MPEPAIRHSQNVATPAAVAEQVSPSQKDLGPDKKLLSQFSIQAKLTVGAPDDPYEREADAVADQVMRMPESGFMQRKCAHCESEEKTNRKALCGSITPFIQAKSEGNATVSNSVASRINTSRGSGSALDGPTQSFMDSRFGNDFSKVKIHTDNESVQLNTSLDAKAFTVGNDIYFNRGQYQPGSSDGKKLLAHELTHVVQQGNKAPVVQRHDKPSKWCIPFMELIDYEAKYGKIWVLYRYNSFTTGIVGEETLIPLNYNIPSVLGDVDVDWMFRLAITQYAFSISGKVFPIMSEYLAAKSAKGGLFILKGFWNTVRAMAPEWDWEYDSIYEEGNWNATTAINKWVFGTGTLKDLFKPAVELCEKS
jgi:hypothetical protein